MESEKSFCWLFLNNNYFEIRNEKVLEPNRPNKNSNSLYI